MKGNNGGWEKLRDNDMDAGRENCGETTGGFNRRSEAWWWNETVQQIIKKERSI